MSFQICTAYAPTTMMEPGNMKKGVKNLLAEKKGPMHPKKARTEDEKNLHEQLNINTRR